MDKMILKRLMNDHKHIAVLLDVLAKKNHKLSQGEAVNFSLIRDVVEYMQVYAEHSHHPLEDITYNYFVKQFSSPCNTQLHEEHTKLAEYSGALMYSLNLILSDVVISREKLVTDLQAYVDIQRSHMHYEESELFPLFAKQLTAQDWDTIKSQCEKQLVDDPLFSDNDESIFEDLKAHIGLV
ncbi:Hemerythrin HHE cation binding domain protein [Shewanella sp. P1-14-1]|uniref:Hemerythrin HHE cation binding domain protein n=1 Tax=Shewanella japonica TaxID=93973 RepID=A0ABM6JJQ3_9GAMM|nr:Hemerythrin HHE cation binding domain protein [Shewanella japonica]KPZ69003.1 Hemerythrin HHE cation binding domain protein [Shewanella sp. P1-14-1]